MAPIPRTTERQFKIDELFFSTTDKKGVIKSGNDVFTRVSGYSEDEIMGRPHNIIRHPDIPRAVFYLLWNYLQAGKSISAYVKNMAKDGSYYWVVACVYPIPDGYLSIRFKPSSAFFPIVQEIYQELLLIEQSYDKSAEGRKDGMHAAAGRLFEILKEKGFDSYDRFMEVMLLEELKSRDSLIAQLPPKPTKILLRDDNTNASDMREALAVVLDQCLSVRQELLGLFSLLDGFVHLNEKLKSKSQFIHELAGAIKILSINALIRSRRLGAAGATLTVVAKTMGTSSSDSEKQILGITENITKLSSSMQQTAFAIASSRLQLEMITFFAKELIESQVAHGFTGDVVYREKIKSRVMTLLGCFRECSAVTLNTLSDVGAEVEELVSLIERLQGVLEGLEFVHFNGRVEAARVGNAEAFTLIFEKALKQIREAKAELQDFVNVIESIQKNTSGIDVIEDAIRESAGVIQRKVEVIATGGDA